MLSASKVFLTGYGTFGGYEVWGWRYGNEAIWHVKVWPEFGDRREHSYRVTDGEFEPKSITEEERKAVLHLVAGWEKPA